MTLRAGCAHTATVLMPRVQRGLTLIEVLVAMTIGLLLLIALGSLLIGSTRSFKVQDDFARMQDNGAYAMNAIGNSIRMAGFYGYASSGEILNGTLNGTLSDAANPCGPGWMINSAGAVTNGLEAVRGLHGLTSANVNASLGCINAANFVSNSPILILRGAEGIQIPLARLGDANFKKKVYIQSDHAGSVLFIGNEYAAQSSERKKWVYDTGGVIVEAPVYAYQSYAYYLRPCSRPSGAGGLCTSSDDGGRPIPTLVRQELGDVDIGSGATSMIEQPVAEGIERLSVLYGLDTNTPKDGIPNQYLEAPGATDWPNIVAIRVAVLVRSPGWQHDYYDGAINGNVKGAAKVYDLNGDGSDAGHTSDDFACSGDDCHYHRHVFAQTFQMRNIAQRSGN